jgi:hypothetical protein
MGLLYERSLVAVVVCGVTAQAAAAALFLATSSSVSERP